MTSALVIKNSRIEGLGALGELMARDGFHVTTADARRAALSGAGYDMLVILGGPQSANDPLPYLKEEQKLVRDYTERDKPVLGICLGAQLIARAFGARVYAGAKKEVGFYHDLHADDVTSGPFAGFDSPFTAFHWHGDTFELPPDARRLASSALYPNQAFRCGSAVGVQFHLEVDEQAVRLWLDKTGGYLEGHSISPDKIRTDIGAYMGMVRDNLARFYTNLKSEFDL